MRTRIKSICIKLAGWAFILLGLAGLVLPVLQGILFLLVGLYLLSSESPWAARLLHKLRERFPKISGKFDEAKAKALEWQARMTTKKSKRAENPEP
jgi:uncharacterized membrane protein YbaN (DUF454 family)